MTHHLRCGGRVSSISPLLSVFCHYLLFCFNTIQVEPDDLCNHVHVMIIGAALMMKAAAVAAAVAARLC